MLTLLLLFTFPSAFAAPGGITLAEAVERAESAPSALAAGSGREAAQAGYAQAWPGRLPT